MILGAYLGSILCCWFYVLIKVIHYRRNYSNFTDKEVKINADNLTMQSTIGIIPVANTLFLIMVAGYHSYTGCRWLMEWLITSKQTNNMEK